MYDVTIIGAGVIGGMIARMLSAYDLKLCIAEKENDVAMGTTKANSAIIHAGFDAVPGTLKAKLNVRGSELMEGIAQELGVKYRRNGSLVLAFTEEDKKELEKLLERGKRNGVKDLRILSKEELHAAEANLSPKAEAALYAPTGAIICPYELTIAAIGNAMENGAELKRCFEVIKLTQKEDGIELTAKDGRTIQTRYVINAAGLYSDRIAALAGDDSFQVHPRRGEYILLDRECGSLFSHTIFRTPSKMGKGILMTPTVDGNLLIGPTSVDQTDKEDQMTTAEGLERVKREASENAKQIPWGKTITSFCGLRSVGSTGDFILKTYGTRMVHAAGIESPGLSASPAIAEYVVNLLQSLGLNLQKKETYCVTKHRRFREASLEEKNEMIRQDRSYGKIVCRCEGVTEGEILEALRTEPKAVDLDGVKRRTRAQMGRCQGGFCSPHIVELIARELEIPVEQVTKFGGNSYVNLGRTKEVQYD